MKIAMVSMSAASYGWAVDGLAVALSAAGHRVTRHSADATYGDAAKDRLSPSGAPAVLATIENLRARLVAQWSIAPPEVVHAHSWTAGKAALLAARAFEIPVVQTFHGLGRTKSRRVEDPIAAGRAEWEMTLVRAAARIIASSSPEVFALLALGASPGAIRLIPGGVDLDEFAPLPRNLGSATGEVFRVATLSSLSSDAGVGDVIEALSDVGGVELAIGADRYDQHEIATGAEPHALENLARARGVRDRVSFRGRIDRNDVAPFLRAADVVICAPRRDTIHSVALEAMACGIPVIASAVGVHLDAVTDGITGTIVPPQAPRQIAYAIKSLQGDAPLRERFSRFGVERIRARHGWARIADETLEVYRSAAASRTVMSGLAF